MSEVHRYKVVKMLSQAGNRISYDHHGPDVVLAEAYDQLRAENEAPRKSRVPAGLYRELVALRELRDHAKKYVDSYLLDEVEAAENCVSEDQHLCAAELSECLMNAFEAHWDSAMSGSAQNEPEAR
ncbi:hypothetical protein WLF18_01205 [Pseudomonas shirazensis]|uniref:Uncharacterized protein n=1 Tax=Pseudomonas shirazensis TaxID=2745494 RepID=A0ABU8ZTT6_9PSED